MTEILHLLNHGAGESNESGFLAGAWHGFRVARVVPPSPGNVSAAPPPPPPARFPSHGTQGHPFLVS